MWNILLVSFKLLLDSSIYVYCHVLFLLLVLWRSWGNCPLLARSASSFSNKTCSQNEENTLHASSLAKIALIIIGNERSGPTPLMSLPLTSVQAGQLSSVCWAISSGLSQWWQLRVCSFSMRHKYAAKHPWPDIICVIRHDSPPHVRFIHSSRTGWIALTLAVLKCQEQQAFLSTSLKRCLSML